MSNYLCENWFCTAIAVYYRANIEPTQKFAFSATRHSERCCHVLLSCDEIAWHFKANGSSLAAWTWRRQFYISSGTVHLRKNPVLYLIRNGTLSEKILSFISSGMVYTIEILSCISSGTVHSQKSVQYLIRYGTLSDNPVLYLVRYGTLSENLSCISHQVWDTQVILSYISSGMVHSSCRQENYYY